jgi:hypothetical protein
VPSGGGRRGALLIAVKRSRTLGRAAALSEVVPVTVGVAPGAGVYPVDGRVSELDSLPIEGRLE